MLTTKAQKRTGEGRAFYKQCTREENEAINQKATDTTRQNVAHICTCKPIEKLETKTNQQRNKATCYTKRAREKH